jgi:hypothetical protein
MNKITITFIVLVIILFGGIGILIKPDVLVSSSLLLPPTSSSSQSTDNSTMLRTIIIVGSGSTITGLVGLAVLGFVIFREQK